MLTNTNEAGYIVEMWLNPWKERLVRAWTSKHAHFNNIITSRCEGIYQLIKQHFNNSQYDLFQSWRAIHTYVANQMDTLDALQAAQQIKYPSELAGPLFDNVRGFVSHEVMRKIMTQRRLLVPDAPPCTGLFITSLGLP
jgi:hypothetical protein